MTTPSYPVGPANTYAGYNVKPPVPATVRGAFWIYVLACLTLIAGVVLLITSSSLDAAIRDNAGRVTASGLTIASVISTVKIITVVVVVIIVGLYLLFAFKMRAGRNWARIVLTVLSALSIASAASPTSNVQFGDQTYSVGAYRAASWIGVALAVLAIILMFMRASNAYFTASKVARMQQRY